MQLITKTFRAVKGMQLMLRCTRSFDAGLLKDKRIALVGPADSALNTGKGSFIDSFDYVVRINKAPLLIKSGKYDEDIGRKTDILFHSFFENNFSGGGLLDIDLYEQLGINYLVKATPTLAGYRDIFNFYKKYMRSYPVYTGPYVPYGELKERFGSFRPTNGLCAMKFLLEADFTELYITGFTFFKTGYVKGYRDALQTADQARQYIAGMQIHNPDLEFEEFRYWLRKNAHKKILLDDTIKDILAKAES